MAPEGNGVTRMDASSPLRILLVEDHADMREVLSDLLLGAGYHVTTAEDVGTARAAVAAEHFDIVLCDLRLPDGSGTDVLSAARAHGSPKAVVLSASADRASIERSLEAGFADHVVKGGSFDDLRTVIERVAGRSG